MHARPQSRSNPNFANAQFSSGPKTAEGKARSSRNNLKHGFTLGVFAIEPTDKTAYDAFQAEFRVEMRPEGAMVEEAFQQFIDAAWRLRKIRAIVREWTIEHAEDPFVHPDTEAKLRQLNRYHAAAEMVAFRAIRPMRELQTTALFRKFNLTAAETTVLLELTHPGKKMMLGNEIFGVEDRILYYRIYGPEQFTCSPVATPYTPPG